MKEAYVIEASNVLGQDVVIEDQNNSATGVSVAAGTTLNCIPCKPRLVSGRTNQPGNTGGLDNWDILLVLGGIVWFFGVVVNNIIVRMI